ncbi:MAG TPA: glycosyltransferase family 4 protein [Candidatus Binataceae bacterium]
MRLARLAIVTRNARVVGGVETYLDTVVPLLAALGHEISFFCESAGPSTSRTISRPRNAPAWSVNEMGARQSLDSLRRWQPDLIYSHGLSDPEIEAQTLMLAPAMIFAHDYRAACISGRKAFAFPIDMPCTRSLGAGCVLNFYPRRCGGLNPLTMVEDFRQAARRLALLRSARAVLTASSYMREEHIRNGLSAELVRCVGYPIVDRTGGPLETTDLIPPVQISDGFGASATVPLRLLFAGRMEPLKGGRILLDALPMISSALSRPLVMTFAGEGGARFEWTRRAEATARNHPALRVEFTGWIDSVALTSLFDASDLLVVPSLWPEPFGLVGPEAGLRGLPAAAFATGGIPEWLTEGVNGALAHGVPPSPAALADAIVRCLRDPFQHARLRRGAIELARRFAPERHLEALTKVIDEILPQAQSLPVRPIGRDSAVL